jgi:hypothetical protein
MLWLDENGDFLISNDRKPNIIRVAINWDDLNLDKINDMLLIRPKFDIFPPNDFLPFYEIRLSSESMKI